MNQTEQYDVVVAGGGSAGVAAAIGAAKSGARTALIEQAGCLGGASTMRQVLTYCGFYTLGAESRQAVHGVGEALLVKLRRLGAVSGPFRHRGVFVVFDPEAVKVALDELCAEAGVDVLLHAFVSGATREDGQITAVSYQDHSGAHRIEGKAFVDATGDCDLAFFSGASTRYGNHGAANLGTLGTRFGGIPPEVEVTATQLEAAIKSAIADGAAPLTKSTSVLVRLPLSGDLCCYLASEDYDPRDVHSLSRAETHGRTQAWAYLEIVRSLPGCGKAYLAATGPEFGTRESRHIDAVEQLTWQDILDKKPIDDSIALGAWGVEWHDRKTFKSDFIAPPGGLAYEIPLSCLISKDTPNLLAAGRTADGDREAGASLRVMGTAFATGQAAGVAAAQFAERKTIDSGTVRSTLKAQDALVDASDVRALPVAI